MRSPGLVVMGVAAALVVGYAFYTLLTPPPPRAGAGRSRAEARASAGADEPDREDDDGAGADRARRPRARAAGSSPKPTRQPALAVEPAPAEPGLPPRPTPEIPLDEARKQFADFMAELDELDSRGVVLTSPEWVEHYKRGHDALLPLQQHLDWQVPAQADELRRANEDMRAKLSRVDPGQQPSPSQ